MAGGPKIAHGQGFEIYAVLWGYGSTFGGGRISKLLTEHPEVFQIDKNGKMVGAGCLKNPSFGKIYVNYIERLSHYGYDGYLIDEPTPNDCYCPSCQEKYRKIYNEDLPREETCNLRTFRTESALDSVRG